MKYNMLINATACIAAACMAAVENRNDNNNHSVRAAIEKHEKHELFLMCDEILTHEMKIARDDRIFKEKLNNSLKKIMRGSKKQLTAQRYEDGVLLYKIHIEYGYTYNKISVNIGCVQRSCVYTHKEWQYVNDYLYDMYRRLNNIEPKLQPKNGFECF